MDIRRNTSPFECNEVMSLWAELFGEAEAELERVQINGSEAEYNNDIVYTAWENDVLLGIVHITVAKNHPELCGVSGVCTSLAARGKGVSKILFKAAMDEADALGVKYSFLGTGNPIAAKVYSAHGFCYLPNTGAMGRFAHGAHETCFNTLYGIEPKRITIAEGTQDLRLPIIPLVYSIKSSGFLDINTDIISKELIKQVSCMGLYPRYLKLAENGGKYYTAAGENGVVGAVVSVMAAEEGVRADFFGADSFKDAYPMIMERVEAEYGEVYLQIADADEYKQRVAESLGYIKFKPSAVMFRNTLKVDTHIYKKI